MTSTPDSDVRKLPAFDHLFKVGVLWDRATKGRYPESVQDESDAECLRYRDEGLILQKFGKDSTVAPTKKVRGTDVPEPTVFSGQGIIYAVIDDREGMREGRVTTIDIIADAIEAALDHGHETSEEIARYLTTSAFQHVPNKRVRFNSVLKAGDAVGAQITRKLYNAYNDLAQLADDEEDPKVKAEIRTEATGFAEALNVVISPFSCEDKTDPRLVDWDEVDRITTAFEKEQRVVRRERKGNPQ
jgi:hypothetical protein